MMNTLKDISALGQVRFCFDYLNQEVMLRVRFFPARVQPESLLAQIVALRVETFFPHMQSDGLHRRGK